MSKIPVEERMKIYGEQLNKLLDSTNGMDKFAVQFMLMKLLMQRIDPELDCSWLLNSHDEAGNPVKIKLRNERLKGTCIAQMSEIMESMNLLDWKWWKKMPNGDQWWNNDEKSQELLDEIADELHFAYQKAILAGFDETDVFMAFAMKHLENMRRQDRGY